MNVTIRQFQESMAGLINSTPLPMEVKRLAVCDILHKIEAQAEHEITCELQAKQKESQEKEE